MDAADPYANALGTQQNRLNPFTDQAAARYSPLSNYEEHQDQAYVESYLLGRPPTVHPGQPPVPPPPSGDYYPTNAAGQPISELEAQEANEREQEKPKGFDFFAKFRRGATPAATSVADVYEDAHSTLDEKSGYHALQDDDDQDGRHFGPAPLGPQARRNKMRKRVALTAGNLVLDCPIPSRLNSFLPRKDAEEFRFMRYSAVTCDVRLETSPFSKCQRIY